MHDHAQFTDIHWLARIRRPKTVLNYLSDFTEARCTDTDLDHLEAVAKDAGKPEIIAMQSSNNSNKMFNTRLLGDASNPLNLLTHPLHVLPRAPYLNQLVVQRFLLPQEWV